MKKTFLLFLFLLAALLPSYSQVSFGIKAGLNFAKEVASASGISISSDGITSFHAGVYAKIKAGAKFGVQPELLYSGQGGGSSSGDDKFGYLLVPVMLRYDIVPAFNIQAGPQLGLLMSATSGGVDVKSQLKSTDFAIALGAGSDLPMGLNFAFRYVIGMSDIQANPVSGVTLKNSMIMLSVGFKIAGE